MSVAPVGPGADAREVARRLARSALDRAGRPGDVDPPPAALRDSLVRALAAEGVGDRRSRVRVASDVTLLARLLGDGGAGPVDGLARHIAFVLARPSGVALWEDLRRLTTLLDDLGAMMRAQRRRGRVRPGAAEQARGTELVMGRAMDSFAATWRSARAPGPPPETADPGRTDGRT